MLLLKVAGRTGAFLLVLFIAGDAAARADGLMSNGHIRGDHTNLVLTAQQCKELDGKATKLRLTDQQRLMLKKATGVTDVDRLYILPKNIETCTCELSNVGVRTSKETLEVSNRLFGRHVEDEDVSIWSSRADERNKNDEREGKIANPPKAVLLRRESKSLMFKSPERARALLEEAVALDSNYVWARRDLAQCYDVLADKHRGNLPLVVTLHEKALAVLDSGDKVMGRKIRGDLERAKTRLSCTNEPAVEVKKSGKDKSLKYDDYRKTYYQPVRKAPGTSVQNFLDGKSNSLGGYDALHGKLSR